MPSPLPDVGSSAPDRARQLVSVPIEPTPGPTDVVITGEDWLDVICPFLRGGDGTWRSNSPARDHRCWATAPPSELPVLTQQRLCLVRGHDGCERFSHARELRSAALARSRRSDAVPADRDAVPAAPPAGGAVAVLAGPLVRAPRLALAAVAASVLAVTLVLAALLGPGSARPDPTLPAVAASTAPLPSIPGESASVDPSEAPDGFRRYRVREGDTLRTIADRFGITVRQLRAANDLGDPPRLEAGDVLRIPSG